MGPPELGEGPRSLILTFSILGTGPNLPPPDAKAPPLPVVTKPPDLDVADPPVNFSKVLFLKPADVPDGNALSGVQFLLLIPR